MSDTNSRFPAVSPGNRNNLNTLIRAAKAGHLALVSGFDKLTGKYVDIVCAVQYSPPEDGNCESEPMVNLTPFALMDKEMPLYERLVPCTDEASLEAAIREYLNAHGEKQEEPT